VGDSSSAPSPTSGTSAAPPEELQAVILAAGYGRRMRPLSDQCHKALIPMSGGTILGRILDSLVAIGINRVTVVTGYRAEDIERFLRSEYPTIDLHLVPNARYRETNNIVSLSLALESLTFDADVLLIECDLLFDRSLLTRLVGRAGQNVALVDRFRTGMDGTVVTVRKCFITDVYPTDTQDADFSYEEKFKTLNIYRFDRTFCSKILKPLLHAYASAIDPNCYYELVLGMLTNLSAHRIRAEVVEGDRWAEVDDPNDLAVATFQFDEERRSELLDQSFGGHWNFDVLDFSFMRNAHFPTGAMLAAMRHALPELMASYGSTQSVLNQKLGYFLRSDPERLQVLHGASQAFPILGRAFAGQRIAIPEPTFGEYPRHFPDAVPYGDAPGIDWDALVKDAAAYDVVVLVNPNTSTGTTLKTDEVWSLAQATPSTLFWVDESFLAFSQQLSLVELLRDEPLDNVVVLVSLSKCLGVPGLRLGYAYSCRRTLIETIGAELPVWNLTAPAEYLLELLLKFGPEYEASLELTMRDRESLRTALLSLPVVADVPPSGGDFLLVLLHGRDTAVAAEVRSWLLATHRIEVKDVSGRFPQPAPRLRVAVRREDENARLVDALRQLPPALQASLVS
jgi:histidinol-phosphate/aromatic aminotransferase/cobyric acid decarboxylase-like protein/choline kinase